MHQTDINSIATNHIQEWTVEELTLTDGSNAYDVIGNASNGLVRFYCLDMDEAYNLADTLNKAPFAVIDNA
jgi:hypothetical protein